MKTINPTPSRLQKAFNFVRRFFPAWDRKKQWQIRFISGVHYIAQCNIDLKTIELRVISDDDLELYLLLIHEICHTTDLGHSEKWQKRMMLAASRINKSGYQLLAREVINEVNRYQGLSNINAKFIYRKIAAIVIDNKSISFEKLMADLSRQYFGGETVPYKHCRTVYDRVITHWDRIEKIRYKLSEKKEVFEVKPGC